MSIRPNELGTFIVAFIMGFGCCYAILQTYYSGKLK